jgi:hypothetical protein
MFGRGGWFALALLVVGVTLWSGCATSSIEKRRADRPEAYAALSPDARVLVDRGEIARGMETNAVFIALGRPTRIEVEEGPNGVMLTWSYSRACLKSRPVHSWRPDGNGGLTLEVDQSTFAGRYLARRVVFRDGRVIGFQTYVPTLP